VKSAALSSITMPSTDSPDIYELSYTNTPIPGNWKKWP
jgi:hypothetical protein